MHWHLYRCCLKNSYVLWGNKTIKWVIQYDIENILIQNSKNYEYLRLFTVIIGDISNFIKIELIQLIKFVWLLQRKKQGYWFTKPTIIFYYALYHSIYIICYWYQYNSFYLLNRFIVNYLPNLYGSYKWFQYPQSPKLPYPKSIYLHFTKITLNYEYHKYQNLLAKMLTPDL